MLLLQILRRFQARVQVSDLGSGGPGYFADAPIDCVFRTSRICCDLSHGQIAAIILKDSAEDTPWGGTVLSEGTGRVADAPAHRPHNLGIGCPRAPSEVIEGVIIAIECQLVPSTAF